MDLRGQQATGSPLTAIQIDFACFSRATPGLPFFAPLDLGLAVLVAFVFGLPTFPLLLGLVVAAFLSSFGDFFGVLFLLGLFVVFVPFGLLEPGASNRLLHGGTVHPFAPPPLYWIADFGSKADARL
jgi:hypothetical protein